MPSEMRHLYSTVYTAQGCSCWLSLFNQSSQPSCKKRGVNNNLSTPMASVYFHFLSTCQVREKGDVQSYPVQERFYSISKK